MITKVILAIVEIFAIFGIGAFIRHLKIIEEKDLNKLSRMVVDIMFPMMAFSSITTKFDASQLNDLWLMPLLGFGLMATGAVLGFGLKYGMKDRSPERLATFHHYCAINNYVFLPLIILENLWGKEYLPLLFIMNIGSTIGFWTIGVSLLAGGNIKQTIKNIFSINLAAVVAALLFVFLKIPLPGVVENIFSKVGNCSVPLILLLIGAAIYDSPHIFKNKWDAFYLGIVRLVIIPLIIVFILKLLPLPENAFRVTFIVALMPVSASSAVITRRFGGSPEFAGQAIILTTLASIITVPVMIYLFG